MEGVTTATSTPFISGWSHNPIPNFILSAAGLLVLADLSTIAQRTALRGGSSWFDSLLLAPGLHYQQAADELARAEGTPMLTAVEVDSTNSYDAEGNGRGPVTHRIVNQAVISYILRSAKEGQTVVLDVGNLPVKAKPGWTKRRQSQRNSVLYGPGKQAQPEELSWAAHALYLTSPLLTCFAIVLVVLLGDCEFKFSPKRARHRSDYCTLGWALALIVGLMCSRFLNIIVIKSRSRPKPHTLPPPFTQVGANGPIQRITQYIISLSPSTVVILRGINTDLYALTTTVWLRPKSPLESYLEAIAKMLVFVVAAVSGNATQAGNLVLSALLLVSAGLLALSNAQATGLRNSGKVVSPSPPEAPHERSPRGNSARGGVRDGGGQINVIMEHGRREIMDSWPSSSTMSSITTKDELY